MARSRVCPSCGHDTAGTPQTVEPHYGLTIISCARCGRVVPCRRWAGYVGWWRTARRWRDAGIILALQVATAVFVLGLLPMACLGLNASLLRHRIDPYTVFLGDRRANWNFAANFRDWRQTGEVAILAAVVGLAALGGVWIGTGLKHRGLARAWVVVGSLVLAMTQIGSWVRWSLMGSLPGGASVPWSEAFGAGVLGIGAIATVALAMPVGMAVGLVLAELRKFYVQMMVRMARRRRQR